MSDKTYRVRIWDGYHDEYPDEPDSIVTVPEETPTVWIPDPHAAFRGAFDIHPDDAPANLEIYTSDSVRSPPGYESHVETGYWDGPVEKGLPFDPERYDEYPPFGCEIWGRVMFYVEDIE
jgi:hypothetical protein